MVGRHAARSRRAALTALGALVLTALPAAASAAPPPAPGPVSAAARTLGADAPPAQVLRAMRRDLGLTPDQASARLVNEAEAGTRAGMLRNTLGDRFAGAWVSGATSAELTVATTDAADTAAIEAQGAKAAVVDKGLAELRAVKEKLDAAAARAPGPPRRRSGSSTSGPTGSWSRPPASRRGRTSSRPPAPRPPR